MGPNGMIIAGLDEAGYGPLLGPLVVSGVAWEIPDALTDADLWDVLAASIARTPGKKELRLPIADSKVLYDRKAGLIGLERTALVMLRAAGHAPATMRELVRLAAPRAEGDLGGYPWYADFDRTLPASTSVEDIATRANAVRRDLAACGIRPVGLFIELICEGHFNRHVDRTNNKATVLLEVTLGIVRRILDATTQPVRFCLDRQGGRKEYVEAFKTYLGKSRCTVLEETPTRSAYRMGAKSRRWTAEFLTQGETRALLIALASIYSKYLRELLMEGLNGYFRQRVEGLAPTAGYYGDATRFIEAVSPAIAAARIDRGMLVRCR